MKSLTLAPLAAGAVVLCGVLLSFEATAAESGAIPPGNPRTLDLTVVPMTITEPGTYVVRHSWDLQHLTYSTAITVMAANVVIDFQGYQVLFGYAVIGVKIKGGNVTLRNGALSNDIAGSVLRSSGLSTVLENMSIYSYEGLQLSGARAEVRDSDIHTHGATTIGSSAVIERSKIWGEPGAIVLANDNRVVASHLSSGGDQVVIVRGNHNTLIDNVLGPGGSGAGFSRVIGITGNGNQVMRNTVLVSDLVGPVIDIDGTGNTIDGNVAPPLEGTPPASIGVRFRQAGNFYGNNRMWAQTPYDLGGVPQTDWGGNVSY